jgi:broad specificity phosphatase PhoE
MPVNGLDGGERMNIDTIVDGPLRLWLVRHGETAWNAEGRFCGISDLPLSLRGEQQVQWLRKEFRGRNIAGVYASDLLRARQTAEQLALLPIQSSGLWREISFGRWEGLTYREIRDLPENDLRFFTDPVKVAPPEGETLLELAGRVREGLMELMVDAERAQSRQEMVLVSHAGPLRVLLCLLLHVPLEYHWQFQLAPGSYSALDLSLVGTGELPIASLALLNMQPPVEEMKEEYE